MAKSRRVQLLMDPEEYRKIQRIAHQRAVSVAEVVRTAVRDRWLRKSASRDGALTDILSMGIPVEDWTTTESIILEVHDAGVS